VTYFVVYDVPDDSLRIGLGPALLAFAVHWTSAETPCTPARPEEIVRPRDFTVRLLTSYR
jgi:hypothetical protein